MYLGAAAPKIKMNQEIAIRTQALKRLPGEHKLVKAYSKPVVKGNFVRKEVRKASAFDSRPRQKRIGDLMKNSGMEARTESRKEATPPRMSSSRKALLPLPPRKGTRVFQSH